MHMLKLNGQQIALIYEHQMLRDFTPQELKPLELLLRLEQARRYAGYGFYEGEELLGYALLAYAEHSPDVLLDYFAVCPSRRNQGLGQAFLTQLMAELGSGRRALLLEVEDPHYGRDEADRDLRSRRMGFYQRCGVELRKLRCCVQEEHYVVMVKPLAGDVDDCQIQASLTDIYTAFFGQARLAEKAAFGEEK